MTPSTPSAAPSRAAIVANPSKRGIDAITRAVAEETRRTGRPKPQWIWTTPDDPGAGQTRRALDEGCDLVVAAGGDGTIRRVAEVLRGTGVPMGIVPIGTGNLLARNLGLPLSDHRAAVRTALSGADRAIDLGVAETTGPDGERTEHPFLVMAGLGLDAAMIANTRASLKKRVGWLAYVDGGVRSLPKNRGVRIRYRLDDGSESSAHVSTILIGNCGSLPGGMELLPDARIDDGLLDIAILQPRSVWEWLLVWRKVAWENRVLRKSAIGRSVIRFTNSERRRMISYLRGRTVTVTTDRSQPFEIDGDAAGEVSEVTLRLDHRALVVRVPEIG